ncbi:hypothetical protein [Algibacter lectus]|uniref:Uncharacterized protein n=1 Tax=Algibacter lectus TaxID=221126 RepID=A0A4R8MJJ5_9FLAO|nr:hypothetical protein [Algibacter lectus]MWW23146.1 hypothetical protein [Algibacter lectus]TDY64176.1 hypothetical protein DFQ06_1079 [Algibacter lectus]
MIDNIKYATISDIYVKDLMFYNENDIPNLIKFCKNNNITCLPGRDRKSCYKLIGHEFKSAKLSPDLVCNPTDLLFDSKTLDKFKSGNHDEVLFVIEKKTIKGVVHVTDYNNSFINFETYKLVYQFENLIRKYLIKKNETNDSLISWMKEEGQNNSHFEKRYKECMPDDYSKKEMEKNRRLNFNPFQTFFLNDLLYFLISKNYLSSKFNVNSVESIKIVRNWVAHNKDLAHLKFGGQFPIYQIKELERFVKHINIFFERYEELDFSLKEMCLK